MQAAVICYTCFFNNKGDMLAIWDVPGGALQIPSVLMKKESNCTGLNALLYVK
jgi:hypothetical protein